MPNTMILADAATGGGRVAGAVSTLFSAVYGAPAGSIYCSSLFNNILMFHFRNLSE